MDELIVATTQMQQQASEVSCNNAIKIFYPQKKKNSNWYIYIAAKLFHCWTSASISANLANLSHCVTKRLGKITIGYKILIPCIFNQMHFFLQQRISLCPNECSTTIRKHNQGGIMRYNNQVYQLIKQKFGHCNNKNE